MSWMPNGFKIFLVDDDPDDQEIFSMTMERILPEASCEFADDGVNALIKLRSQGYVPHLILLDINMPRMGGVECLAEMKKLPHLVHIPTYMYSTSANPSIVALCLRRGANGFIQKEIKPSDLQQRISEILRAHKFLTTDESEE